MSATSKQRAGSAVDRHAILEGSGNGDHEIRLRPGIWRVNYVDSGTAKVGVFTYGEPVYSNAYEKYVTPEEHCAGSPLIGPKANAGTGDSSVPYVVGIIKVGDRFNGSCPGGEMLVQTNATGPFTIVFERIAK